MKKTLFALVLVLVFSFFFVSCQKYDDTELRTRLDKLENSTIASINQQISGILSSISSLEGVDADLKKAITELQNKDGDFENEITKLQDFDASLEKRVEELKGYVDKELSANKDWINATFSTLAQYNATCDELAKIKESLTKLKDELTSAISDEIAASETSIKKWINEQLAGYWTIAEAQAKLDELKDTQADEIEKVQKSIVDAKTELTDAYTKAIKEAIEQSEGRLSKQIEEVNKALEEKIGRIEERLTALEDQLNILLRDFDIIFDDNNIGILAGGTTTVGYTIVGATDNTIVKALGQNGWSAKVTPNGTDKGTITVHAPNPLTEDEIIVLVYDGEVRTIMSSINFVTGRVTPTMDSVEMESEGGTFEIQVSSNIDYSVSIPSEAKSWVSFLETKSMVTNTLRFKCEPNPNSYRTTIIHFVDASTNTLSSFSLIQYGPTQIATDGYVTITYEIVSAGLSTIAYNTSSFVSMSVDGSAEIAPAKEFSFAKPGKHTISWKLADPTTIGEDAFYSCTLITEAILSNTIETIGVLTDHHKGCFQHCSNLTSCNMPTSLVTIGVATWDGTALAGEIVLPPSVKTVGHYAFQKTPITAFTFGEGVTTTSMCMFQECKNLKDIYALPKQCPPNEYMWKNYSFYEITRNGVLHYPKDSDYSKWLQTSSHWLGYYGWTGVADIDDNTSGGGDASNMTGRHDYVDLGLPSGLLWATCNIGANSPEESGDYFGWGEIEPNSRYNWNYYRFGNSSNLSKYNSHDGLIQLELVDDAAHVLWKGDWRMPTHAEELELANNCSIEQTKLNGVSGYRFTGPNGNSIFIPLGGIIDGTDYDNVDDQPTRIGEGGWYWSSTLNGVGSAYASGFCFWPSLMQSVTDHERCDGHMIRPVMIAGTDGDAIRISLPPDDEIWYESHSGKTIPLAEASSLLVSNTYSNGKGIYKFSKALTEIGGMFDYSDQCRTTKENEDFKSLILPKGITRVGRFGISHLSYATKLVLPYNLSSMGSDCLCRFGEKTPDTSNIYFIGEKAPSFVSTSIWNMHDLVSGGNKIDNFYYPENNDSYNSLLKIKIQGSATHHWVPANYSITFAY